MPNIVDLKDERGKLVVQMRGLIETAEKEKRELTAEENQNYDLIFSKQEELRSKIEREERQIALEREMASNAAEKGKKEEGRSEGDQGKETRAHGTKEYNASFDSYIRRGMAEMSEVERRALSVGTQTEGGYTVPQEMSSRLIKFVDDAVVIRGLATKFTLEKAESLGFPELTADPADADWTSELATGSFDSSMAFGKREIKPHPIAKKLKVSNQLLRQSILPIDSLVPQRMAYKLGIAEEKAFLTGSGAQQPLGLFTASNNGVGTARDYSTGNTATEIRFDALIGCKFNLKSQYLRNARWLFHRDAMAQIAQLKDGNGQYLLQPNVAQGNGDLLLGLPVLMSEYAPNTFTTGLYVGMLADFSFYWVVDTLNLQIQRLNELYAETNQTGFIIRAEVDGAPVLAEAFSRLKLA